ncbi:MAG TPA: SAM-dependent methyltransferase [Pyrinomonadaceae bacterium]
MRARQPTSEQTNRLADRLRRRIRHEGSISFREWMGAALYDPLDGYYCRRDLERWGRAGDYLTSPERSPLFAATFARYVARLYEELGAPGCLTIIEAGAGSGHFAAGLLETLERDFPRVFNLTRYLFDEASTDARERVRAKLASFTDRVEFQSVAELRAPFDAAVVFSNELLDALPVHRVKMRDGQLFELYVGCDAEGEFVWTERALTSPRLAEYFNSLQLTLAEGQIAEVNLGALDWIARAAGLLRSGFLITVDYGAEAAELYDPLARPVGTLRAFHNHQFADELLSRPGEQDLTTTVDWTSIRRAGLKAGLEFVLLERQDKFLLQAGLLEQLELASMHAQGEAALLSLRAGARHMILPDSMSASFQVLVQKAAANDDAGVEKRALPVSL